MTACDRYNKDLTDSIYDSLDTSETECKCSMTKLDEILNEKGKYDLIALYIRIYLGQKIL